MTKTTDETLRLVLVRALVVEPNRELAAAVLDRWDELTSGMPMPELLNAVTRKSVTQKRVIELYAREIQRQSPALLASPAWGVINRRIVERWSEAALKRIKLAAWALVEARERS